MLVIFAQLYSFPYFQRLNNPNENVRVWMTRALVEYHELDLTRVTRDWGFVDDKAAASGGRLVSSKAPGTSLLGVPVYAAARTVTSLLGLGSPSARQATWALRVFTVTLPLAAFLLYFARWTEAVTGSPVARDLLVLGLGLGTPLFAYSILFVGHAQGAALAFLAYALFEEGSPAPSWASGRKRLALAGLSAGLSVVFEYQLAVVAALLAAWAAWRHRRDGAAFLIGMLPAAIGLAAYHTCLFGHPWDFPYGHLENPVYAAGHHAQGFHGLGLPSPAALLTLTLSPDLGLFALSPFLLLGVAGAVLAARKGLRGPGAAVLLVVTAMLLLQAGMSNWRAGWSVGPRYSVGVTPLLAGSVAWLWSRLPAKVAVPLVGGLVGASVFMCGISGAMFPHYPPAFDNPVFELALPLARAGYAPYNLGRLLGLSGGWSMVPLAICIVGCWLIAVRCIDRPRDTGTARAALAAAIAAALLALMGRVGSPSPTKADATRVVEALWEPNP